jgi:AAA+ superfamily predicted ATPase
MSPGLLSTAANLVPSDEEVMETQLRELAALWSVQTKPEAKAVEEMSVRDAVSRIIKDAKRRSFIQMRWVHCNSRGLN